MIFAELDFLVQLQFVGVHLGVEAVVLLKHTSQRSYPCIDSAPVGDSLAGVDFRNDIFEMCLAIRLDRSALVMVSVSIWHGEQANVPAAGPTASLRPPCRASALGGGRSANDA